MLKHLLTASLFFACCSHCFAQQTTFKTSKGLTIRLQNDGIYVNGKNLYPKASKTELLIDEPNRLIENGGSAFLFVHAVGSPNKERLYGFKITEKKVDSVVNAISSEIRDMDEDSCLEFGGVDLTEHAPNKDSMYYIPSAYYEIRGGKIRFDSVLTINMDIRKNGVYLQEQVDSSGFCCKVIPIPAKLVNPLIISERIDGPANIRDSAGGAVTFFLNDNVPVTTAKAVNKWYPIALQPDLSPAQFKSGLIEKGSMLYVNGKIVGKAIKELVLADVHDDHGHLTGELTGFTTLRNIRKNTIPEEVLRGIIGQHTAGLNELKDFLKGYQFSENTRCGYTSYFLNEGALYGPTAPMRLELLFEKNKLFGIIHTRKLPVKDAEPYELDRGFFLTVPNYQPAEKVNDFIKKFNDLIKYAD